MSYRLRGFLIHLTASVLLALTVTGVIFFVWYPSPLEQAIGVTSIVLLLLGVDVVAGPLLTLAVCKQGKKSLKYDLSLIVLIQISAFIYGVHIIAQGRPVWISFYKHSFNLVQAYEMNHLYSEKAKPEYQALSLSGPQWVAVRSPVGDERKTIIEGIQAGVNLPERADLYEPLSNQSAILKEKSQDLSTLNQFNDQNKVNAILAKWPDADVYIPLEADASAMSVLLKRDTGDIVAIVNLRPWLNPP